MKDATVIKLSIQRMVCTGCGAEANASCKCGKPYVPKSVRAAEAVAASPEKSNRAIAADIGVVNPLLGGQETQLRHMTQLVGVLAWTARCAGSLAASKARPRKRTKKSVLARNVLRSIKRSKRPRENGSSGLHGLLAGKPGGAFSIPDDSEAGGCDGPEDFWRRSLAQAAGDAVALRALWRKHGYDWKKFDAPSDLISLAKQAAAEWSAIVSAIDKP
jgi:hypothetical protein